MDVLHDVSTTRLEVSKEGDPVTDGLEVVDRQSNPNGVGDGDEMQDSVGGSTEDHSEDL